MRKLIGRRPAAMPPRLPLALAAAMPPRLPLALAAALAAAACSAAAPGGAPSVPPAPPSTSAPPSTAAPAGGEEAVLAAWESFWDVWAMQRASAPIDRAALEATASGRVVDGAVGLFEREREAGAPLTLRRVIPSGVVTEVGDGSATLRACTLISASPTGTPGTLYDAVMRERDGSWVVDELSVVTSGGCVPEAAASAAIEAYERYWDDRDALSNPADPSAAWIAARTTGPHREILSELYADLQGKSLYFRGRPETHPEVVEVLPDWSVVILDCALMDGSGWGFYDVATGEPTDYDKPIADGERDLRSAVMANDDRAFLAGDWKVHSLNGRARASCEYAPTDDALPRS